MAVHRAKNKTTARKAAARFRRKGLNASIGRTSKGWMVYTDQKGRR